MKHSWGLKSQLTFILFLLPPRDAFSLPTARPPCLPGPAWPPLDLHSMTATTSFPWKRPEHSTGRIRVGYTFDSCATLAAPGQVWTLSPQTSWPSHPSTWCVMAQRFKDPWEPPIYCELWQQTFDRGNDWLNLPKLTFDQDLVWRFHFDRRENLAAFTPKQMSTTYCGARSALAPQGSPCLEVLLYERQEMGGRSSISSFFQLPWVWLKFVFSDNKNSQI